MKQIKLLKIFFELLMQRYQEGLEESMKRTELIFDSIDVLSYNLYEISVN